MPENTPPRDPTAERREAEAIAAELSVDDKVRLLSGSGPWHTAAVQEAGLGRVKVTDGPNGSRGDGESGVTAVNLPASIALGASFDRELVEEVGRLLGRETVRKGAQVLLAPTINLARHPLGGRNFESFGEDPLLTSELAVAYVNGVQSEGVGACAKHLVANDVEYRRMTVSSEVDEQTLRQVYLRPFEAVVEAGVWTLMAAYPKLNGIHCTEHHWLLSELLRDEWGFDGLVMSDWGATHHHRTPLEAGMDLEMPGPPRAFGATLAAAIETGEVDLSVVDERVATVVELAIKTGRRGPDAADEAEEQSVDLPEERALVRRAASDGMVLLTNNGVLPLAPSDIGRIAVVGPNAHPGVFQGGGSAMVPAHYLLSPADGVAEALPGAEMVTEAGVLAHRYLPLVAADQWIEAPTLERLEDGELTGEAVATSTTSGIGAMYMLPPDDVADPMSWSQRWSGTLRVDAPGVHRFSVFAVGRSRVFVNGELVVDNWQNPIPGDGFFQMASAEVVGEIALDGTRAEIAVEWSPDTAEMLQGLRFGHLAPVDEEALLDAAVEAAADADAAVVVVGLNADWETESHDRPSFELPGRQLELVDRVVAANERTVVVVNAGGPVDISGLAEAPAMLMAWYPGQEFGRALADVLFGRTDPGGRLPVTIPAFMDRTPTAGCVPGEGDALHYAERLDVGYRWYHRHQETPAAAFGQGLSYAQFSMAEPRVSRTEDGGTTVEVAVENLSDRRGKFVVQAYLDPLVDDGAQPTRALAGFATGWLDGGEKTMATIDIARRAFEHWDGGWRMADHGFRLGVGWSSVDIEHAADL